MSSRKRPAAPAFSSSSCKKRKVTLTTFNKWKLQFEKDHGTMSWLRCDTSNDDRVEMLWCETCRKHEAANTGMKNFSKAWIAGSSNQKTSNVIDHATSEQHRAATARIATAKALNQPVTSYSPIARCLLVMDEAVQERMKLIIIIIINEY